MLFGFRCSVSIDAGTNSLRGATLGRAEFCADELLKGRHMTLPLSALLGATDRWWELPVARLLARRFTILSVRPQVFR